MCGTVGVEAVEAGGGCGAGECAGQDCGASAWEEGEHGGSAAEGETGGGCFRGGRGRRRRRRCRGQEMTRWWHGSWGGGLAMCGGGEGELGIRMWAQEPRRWTAEELMLGNPRVERYGAKQFPRI